MAKAGKRKAKSGRPRGRALTIGVNSVNPKHYSGWSGPLLACEADAQDMAAIAKAAGFATKTLLTRKATRDAVIGEISAAAAALRQGDIFMVSYAGHGGQLPDQDGDEKDLKDETWCLYDGELVDDELLRLWVGFEPGVRILMFSDSCHSGTVARAPMPELAAGGGRNAVLERQPIPTLEGSRAMPPEEALKTYRRNRGFYDAILRQPAPSQDEIKASLLLISGCKDDQLSSDGQFNGLFTSQVKLAWNEGRFSGDYRGFHRAIVDKMPAQQKPNWYTVGPEDARYLGQKPFTI